MKWTILLGSLLVPLAGILLPVSTRPAAAACVMTDVGVQVAIHGSATPATQSNDVTMQSQGACLGNATTTTGTQVYTGSGTVDQSRTSNQLVGDGGMPNPTGINGPVIKVPIGVQVDIHSPAYDPEFMRSVGVPGS